MRYPQFPEPIGVFRCVDRPTYDFQVNNQIEQAKTQRGPGDLQKLFSSGETWTVS
jgi:2-oxoglutarate ferredoxin oxidoreductase subunit beta